MCIYIHTHKHTYVYICIYICIHIYIWTYVYLRCLGQREERKRLLWASQYLYYWCNNSFTGTTVQILTCCVRQARRREDKAPRDGGGCLYDPTPAYVSIRQHTSVYVIRQHTTAYAATAGGGRMEADARMIQRLTYVVGGAHIYSSMRTHTTIYASSYYYICILILTYVSSY